MAAERGPGAVFAISVLQPEQSQALSARLLYVQQHELIASKYLGRLDPLPSRARPRTSRPGPAVSPGSSR
eukprot:15463473-Alexandrium_andersonii.AAC.1